MIQPKHLDGDRNMVANRKPTLPDIQALIENPGDTLTYQDVALILKLSPRTIERYVRLDKIPHRKLGPGHRSPVRFLKSEIAAWLQSRKGA